MPDLKRGYLYRVRSRNLAYAVYDGNKGFVGIRQKFDSLFLATEYFNDPPGSGTVWQDVEELEPCPVETLTEFFYGPDGKFLLNDEGFIISNRQLFDWLFERETYYNPERGQEMKETLLNSWGLDFMDDLEEGLQIDIVSEMNLQKVIDYIAANRELTSEQQEWVDTYLTEAYSK